MHLLPFMFLGIHGFHDRETARPDGIQAVEVAVDKRIATTSDAAVRPLLAYWRPRKDLTEGEKVILADLTPGRITVVDAKTGKQESSYQLVPPLADNPVELASAWASDLDGDGGRDLILATTLYSGEIAIQCYSSKNGKMVWERRDDYPKAQCQSLCEAQCGQVRVVVAGFVARGKPKDAPKDQDWSASGRLVVYGSSNGERLFEILPDQIVPSFGISMANLKDIDGDGWDEMLVGAPTQAISKLRTGVACVVSTKDHKIVRQLECGEGMGEWELSGIGTNVSAIGDVDGDGKMDASVSVVRAVRRRTEGRSHIEENEALIDIVSPVTGRRLSRLMIPDGQDRPEGFGQFVYAAGYCSKDKTACLIVSHPLASGPKGGVGAINLFSYPGGSLLHAIYGDADGDYLGEPVAVLSSSSVSGTSIITATTGQWETINVSFRR